MNKEISKFLDFLSSNNALTFSGNNFIQIHNFGFLSWNEFRRELKKYKTLESHPGFGCTVVEVI